MTDIRKSPMRPMLLAVLIATFAIPAAQAQAPYTRFDEAPQAEAPSQAEQRAWTDWLQRSAAAVAERGQPRDLALAAMLRSATTMAGHTPRDDDAPSSAAPADAQADAWRRSAADKAGDDALANALLMAGGDAPLRLRAAQRWLGADPENLAPLLYRGGRIDTLLADARAARRFDLGMLEQVRWIQAALLRHPPTATERAALADAGDYIADEHAATIAMTLWAAFPPPGLAPMLQACTPDALRGDAARLRDCRHIGTLMADTADTQLGRMLGLELLARTASTAAERRDAQSRQRTLDWQMLEWGRIAGSQPRDGAAQLVRLLADPSIRSEVALVERVLQEAGVPVTPPADWQPMR
ncbi:hypothetical protein [Luteimonas sp. RC10]|uniref:hypothetical protein n=1 Tax=Luteimonas sp. RC10 TaxID=2587035 RepID=UPI00160AC102|nr:hypothetical protein [Luteimonas sp. RC10]MBB3342404.1 hypothetical protein [Luteimonas sp. RC10]